MNEFANIHYQKANHLSEIGRWREAIKEAGLCLAIEPSHYNAICTISRCYLGLEDNERSLEFAEKAIALNPQEEWAYRLQACVYRRKNKLKKALKAAEEAVKVAPQEIYALKTLASIQLDLNKVKAAEKIAETMRSISPDSFETHEMMGYVALNKYKTDEALIHFERALKINPDSAQALSSYAWALYARAERLSAGNKKRMMLKNAIEVYELSLQANPTLDSTKDNLKKAIDLYVLTDTYTLITILSIAIWGVIVFLTTKLKIEIPDFLNISLKPIELFIINILMLIEVHICGLVYGNYHAIKTLSPKTQMFLASKKHHLASFPFLFLYAVFLLIPLIIFVWRTSIWGFGSIFEITLFDWISLIITTAILIYYLRFLWMKFSQTRLWNWLKPKSQNEL